MQFSFATHIITVRYFLARILKDVAVLLSSVEVFQLPFYDKPKETCDLVNARLCRRIIKA